ncbi:MAG: anti-sigma factor [Anaerolineales bacterium]|nr:anti-sigma factor [Anaerolineales bacterium]
MSRENCLPYQENLIAYSLGALDAEEIAALESHLKTCTDCQTELLDYQQIAAGLVLAVPRRLPPSSLRQKLAGRLPSAQKRTSSLFALSFKQFAAGAVLAVLLGLNIFSALQIQNLNKQQKALAERLSAEQKTIAILSQPGTQILSVNTDLTDTRGSILFHKDMATAVLILWNLPELEASQTYQIWLIDSNGEKISSGLFLSSTESDYTTASVQSAFPIGQFAAVGITVEPSGGSQQPTSSPIVVVEL